MNTNDELNAEFIKPPREFAGRVLAPWNERMRLLSLQVRTEQDSTRFFCYSVLFLLIHYYDKPKETVKLAWNLDDFRMAVLDWADRLTEEQRDEAVALVADILQESGVGKVEVIPDDTKPGTAPGN
jgi:hypothetical protein